MKRINFERIEDHWGSWKKDQNEPSLLFLAIIRISHALDHLFLQSPEKSAGVISFEDRCHSWGSPRTIFFRGRSATSTAKNLSSPWRFKTMQIPEKTILFLVSPYCLTVQRKMRRASREVGETWPRTMLYLPYWYWRSTMAKENKGAGYMKRVRVNRTCCFPFASKKSSRMNGIISPRGNCEESLIEIHYSSVYFRRISGYPSEKGRRRILEGRVSMSLTNCLRFVTETFQI